MSIIGSNILAGASGQAGYNLNNSLRFRASNSASLSRTPSTGNQQKWTWSGWVKRGTLGGTYNEIFGTVTGATDATYLTLTFGGNSVADNLSFQGASTVYRQTTQLFRDPSAWYHIVCSIDTTQATAANRIKLYVNGSEITTFTTNNNPSQNANLIINSAVAHQIFKENYSLIYTDGYLADVNFVDGSQLTPSSFGETSLTTGQWIPKAYSGSYGTNGFKLNFSDASAATAAAIGKDSSGNGNNWTPSGISVTAGTTYDAMIDVPTNTSATVGNYCVLNPLDTGSNITLSAANLQTSQGASAGISKGTIGISSGKWYWEVTLLSGTTAVGIADITSSRTQNYVGQTSTSYGYYSGTGSKYNNATGVAYGATYTTNDVIGVALDMDAGTLTFYKNNTSQGTAYSSLSGTFTPAIGNDQSNTTAFNAGQRPFTYTAPSGFVALNTYNLPTPTILQGNKYMDATLYTGTGAALTVTNAGAFKPDLVWAKNRSAADSSGLYDSVRGVNKRLISNLTNAEDTSSGVSAFNSNGFSLGTAANYNTNGNSFVGWQWQAGQGTTTVGTGTGGITSVTQSVNATAGFSIVTYTGSGTNGTVTHGLGVAPAMVIVKRRSSTGNWNVRHVSITAANSLYLNLTNASQSDPTVWNSTVPTSTVFSIGTDTGVNASGGTYVAYCWAEISGYSKAFSYTGNASTDGPFVFCNFRPRFILFKNSSAVTVWIIFDTARNTYNFVDAQLRPNESSAENSAGSAYSMDILSNGFKLRSSDSNFNGSGNTIIGMAFAESPFKNSNAR